MDVKQHLIDLSNTPGISSYEDPIRELIEWTWRAYTDDLRTDALGNLLATLRGTQQSEGGDRRKILLTAHMDEIGLIVTDIEGEFLRFTRVGGVDKRILLSQPVIVHGEKPIPGLIGSRPPHVLPAAERKKFPDLEDLVIDTGLSENQLRKLAKIGTPVTFDIKATALNGEFVSGKAFDNRASVAILTALLEELKGRTYEWDVLLAATTQEEVGLKGGKTIAWHTRPDIAVVLDVTFGVGTSVGESEGYKLEEGAVLAIGPNFHPKLFDMLRDAAKSIEVTITSEPYTGRGGTEAWAMQVSRDGVPTALYSVPLRNMHSPVEIISVKDVKRTARVLAAFITSLDEETISKLALE